MIRRPATDIPDLPVTGALRWKAPSLATVAPEEKLQRGTQRVRLFQVLDEVHLVEVGMDSCGMKPVIRPKLSDDMFRPRR